MEKHASFRITVRRDSGITVQYTGTAYSHTSQLTKSPLIHFKGEQTTRSKMKTTSLFRFCLCCLNSICGTYRCCVVAVSVFSAGTWGHPPWFSSKRSFAECEPLLFHYPLLITAPSLHLVYDILLYDITFLCSENTSLKPLPILANVLLFISGVPFWAETYNRRLLH